MKQRDPWSCEHCGRDTTDAERTCDHCRHAMCLSCTAVHDDEERCPYDAPKGVDPRRDAIVAQEVNP